jgi:hypothetical protein
MKIEVSDEVILDNLYINIVLGRDLFEQIIAHYGKAGWNAYMEKMLMHNTWAMFSTPEPTEDDDHCMPTCVEIDWSGLSFIAADLSGLDLNIPKMEGCNFKEADLSGSRLGTVSGSSFQDANLGGTVFESDISGCDFRGARVADTVFNESRYFRENPPIHLPESRLRMCKTFPEHWSSEDGKTEEEQGHKLIAQSIDLRSFWGKV